MAALDPARRVRLAQVRKERVEQQYAELRALDPEELRACVARACTLSFQHKLGDLMHGTQLIELLADIELALVECALRNRARGGR